MMTSASPVFLDTNILVYANLALSPWHAPAVLRLTALDVEGTPLWVSRQVLREYLAAMTRPGELTGTIPLPALLNDVRYVAQRLRVADEGPRDGAASRAADGDARRVAPSARRHYCGHHAGLRGAARAHP